MPGMTPSGSSVAELLAALDEEVARTRPLLERVPAARLDWRPHPRSRTAGELALHLARIPGWTATLLARDGYDLAGDDAPPGDDRASREEILALFEANAARARAALAACPGARLGEPWELRRDGQVRRAMTRGTALRVFLLDHLVHHRAQLGVYLRLLDVPVPALYGSSADEPA
jgi:uncharacterized damage-inducible protein DinB